MELKSVNLSAWKKCNPTISYNNAEPGCIEVFWNQMPEQCLALISHFQLYLNNVSYRSYIGPHINKVLVKGLAACRNYHAVLVVHPNYSSLEPVTSNPVTIKSGRSNGSTGGPLISLKANPKHDQITLSWKSIDSEDLKIEFYELMVNGEKRDVLRAQAGRHRLTVEGCRPGVRYYIAVVALPCGGAGAWPLQSNQLDVCLPLDVDDIHRPAIRRLCDDFYDEYIEILDGVSRNI